MKKHNKYAVLFLLVAFGVSFVAQAQESAQTTSAEVNTKTTIGVRADFEKIRQEQEALRKERLQKEEELRKQRNDEILKLRMETKAKVDSGEIKPAEALKMLNSQSKDDREKTREEVQVVREEFKTSIEEGRGDIIDLLQGKRDSIIKAIQDKRELFKIEFEAKKEEMQTKREEMKTKFQADLLKIKDENKRDRVEKISDNFAELNITLTTRASANVDKIETVLVAIESRADKAAANGADVTKVRSAIVNAETSIVDARAAIALQVSKVYTASISSEATVKTSLESTRNQFKKDIEVMKSKVKAAHDATKRAAEVLKQIPNVDAEVEVSVEASTN
ncbi:MAG: hypothetical protein KBC11_00090 [Candidatus Pacebacteria bacterium]|nr:hypothetical protein [Candidatus Paceibacterota bacterium]